MRRSRLLDHAKGSREATGGAVINIPVLTGEGADAVAHRGSHIQIIAAAGSGKTEVVSQRVASLLATEPPETIAAFTFTEKAAEELKERIRRRVVAVQGQGATDRLGRLFVGTIHAYCFRLLQTYVPQYETYTPMDENQLVNFLYREGHQLGIKHRFGGGLFQGISSFLRSVDVVENELLNPSELPDEDFKSALLDYYTRLDGYRLMSFGTQIVRAVEALQVPEVHARVTSELRHLIVDEYQDVNPAQERLIELLSKPAGSADLVVVGDDDQAIYQWRGSNVANIVSFADRYDDVTQFRLLTNRRSRAPIVELANDFAKSIPGRLDKQMLEHRPAQGPAISVVTPGHVDEQTEADAVALDIVALHDDGVPYRDIAILVRGKVAYACLLDALEAYDVPVQPGGRSGLFEQPEAAIFGATYAWLADIDWAARRWTQRQTVELDDLVSEYSATFELDQAGAVALRDQLEAWKSATRVKDFSVSLVGGFYALLDLLGVAEWETTAEFTRNRLGTIARFASVVGDYEAIARRARQDTANPGEQVGGQIGDEWFYKNLALIMVNYAIGGYDDFDGEEDLEADAVALGTVHGAKGLEWPVVFLPSLTNRRFPSGRTGQAQTWLVPQDAFDASRYEGSDADERRLFYVALTRARDWLALSSHQRVKTQGCRPSPYLVECSAHASTGGYPSGITSTAAATPDLAITYSELAAYLKCPHSYLLRNQLGFQAPIQGEVGYGNAVHHIMRVVAEQTQSTGSVPTPRQINYLLTYEFFLPFANKPAHREMRENARKLIFKYVSDHQEELRHTWATERPFELYLPGVVVRGRADVIYDDSDDGPVELAIVDYKTSIGEEVEPLQLQVYTEAGRREGLTVRAAFVHDMQHALRHTVPISDADVAAAEATVVEATGRLRAADYTPDPEATKCAGCDVRAVCGAAI